MQKISLACVIACAALVPVAARAQAAATSEALKSSTQPSRQSAQVTLPPEPGEYAIIYTSMGDIVCRLFDKTAPKTIANFTGLATGKKAWTDPETGTLKHTPLYSGTTFHRVIPGFMIQGGDPEGNGEGTPGYKINDEIDPNRSFDKPGILAMANSGPNTNGSQFFITVAPQPHLDGHYSIFGEVVSGQDVVDAISQVQRDEDDKPLVPVKILRIAIRTVPEAHKVTGAGTHSANSPKP